MQYLRLIGLKSHDCHILMQQLLPVAICWILLKISLRWMYLVSDI